MIEIFYFDRQVKRGKVEDLQKLKAYPLWIDITGITKREAEVMRATFDLHPLTAEDMLNINTRIKVEEFNEYIFCAFYGIQKRKTIGMVEMDFVLGKRSVISSHIGEIPSFTDLKNTPEQLTLLFRKGVDFIMHRLLDGEINNYFPVLESIDDQIEMIELRVTKRPKPEIMEQILALKRLIVMIKKICHPQREKIAYLARTESEFISKKCMPYFRDVHDHAVRVSDTIENYRVTAANTFDLYMLSVSNTTNEVMKVLSIIATIALPLTAISSIYGTNFFYLPGAHHEYGFWIMIVLMVMICIGMLFFFKRRKWF